MDVLFEPAPDIRALQVFINALIALGFVGMASVRRVVMERAGWPPAERRLTYVVYLALAIYFASVALNYWRDPAGPYASGFQLTPLALVENIALLIVLAVALVVSLRGFGAAEVRWHDRGKGE